MKNSLTRKGIAVASTFALALGAFAAVSPASAVTGSADDIDGILAEYTETTSLYVGDGVKGAEASGSSWSSDDLEDGISDDGEAYVKVGTRSGTVIAQLRTAGNTEDLDLDGIRVRAVFGEDAGGYHFDDEDVVFSVSGGDEVINDSSDEDSIVALGRTDASGKATFNWSVNSAGGFEEDYVNVDVQYYVNESWSSVDDSQIQWDNALVDSFSVNKSNTSGNSVALTYTALDQFGGGISRSASNDVLRVTFMSCDGLADAVTKSLVGGQASFNYTQPSEIEVGEYSTVEGELHYTGVSNTPDECSDDEIIDDIHNFDGIDTNWDAQTDVYRNGPTTSVDSDYDQYDTVITYGKFRDGNYSEDSDFEAFVDEEGVWGNSNDVYAYADLIIETEDGPAAYQDVTISGAGLYFYTWDADGDDILKSGSITTTTNSSGDAWVYIYSHKENVRGQTVTVTSGGKSATFKVRSFMNDDIDDSPYDNGSEDVDAAVITWNINKIGGGLTGPALSANTAYTVKVTAKDVWGNPLRDAEISVDADREDTFDPYEDATVAIWGGDLERSTGVGNEGTLTTDSNGVAYFNVRATNVQYPNMKALFGFDMDLRNWDYASGLETEAFDFFVSSFNSGKHERYAQGWTGPQAQAKAGVKKGAVRVGAYNVNGKTVKVYVGGKLVKTATAGKAKYVTRVTGIKSGNKRVTVWVGGKRMLSTIVTVK
jgi:hypothetical protein